jgi:hypothetical protein
MALLLLIFWPTLHTNRDGIGYGVVVRFNAGQDEQIGESEYNRLTAPIEYETWASWR